MNKLKSQFLAGPYLVWIIGFIILPLAMILYYAFFNEDGSFTLENIAKITLPGVKIPWRLYDRETGKAIADVITLGDEKIDSTEPYEIFDPVHTWKRKVVTNFVARKLQVKVFEKGKLVYENPSVKEIADFCAEQVDALWDEVKRFENPHTYYVDLSQKLWDLRHKMLTQLNIK